MEIRLEDVVGAAQIERLRQTFCGRLIHPGQEGYEDARRVWNASVDQRPALIARCATPADVLAAVEFARADDVLVAVRGGGHNVAGNATCDGGIVIDLSLMKGIRVDPIARKASVQPGVVWGELDHATQAFGLAVPGGIMSTTGVAGFTLGGGVGWLMRKFGPACDSLRKVEVVTADGRVLVASPTENADLFWGIRGGGGNFGIVTSFEFELRPVGPTVLAGLIFYPQNHAPRVLRFMREFLLSAPDELTTIMILREAPAAPFLPEEVRGAPVLVIGVCYAGRVEDGERIVRPLRSVSAPLIDLIRPMRYFDFQRISDGSWTPGFQNYWKSAYLAGLEDGAIETIVAYAREITSPLSDMKIAHHLGSIANVGEEETAFSNRSAPFNLNVNTRWTDPRESEKHIAWTRTFFDAMQPYSTGGVYVNFLGREGEDRVKAAYGREKYERLVALKNKYDPQNFFRLNQNIEPATHA